MVALLLLVAQVTSLLIVPLHAIAHAQTAYSLESVEVAQSSVTETSPLSKLFGHDKGLGCDDWSAAFSLDSHPGHSHVELAASLPPLTRAPSAPRFTALPTPSQSFLARAPPRI